MTTTPLNSTGEAWHEVVRRSVGGIRFGSVLITVHDGRVTQVESIERTRLVPDKGETPAAPRASRRG